MRQKQLGRFCETAIAVGLIFPRPRSLAQPASELEASYCGVVASDKFGKKLDALIAVITTDTYRHRDIIAQLKPANYHHCFMYPPQFSGILAFQSSIDLKGRGTFTLATPFERAIAQYPQRLVSDITRSLIFNRFTTIVAIGFAGGSRTFICIFLTY